MKHKEDNIKEDFTTKKAKPNTHIGDRIKSLREELKEEDSVIGALQELLNIISSDDDKDSWEFLKEYLRISPDCKELFSTIILDKTSPRKMTLLWNIIERVLNLLSDENNEVESSDVFLHAAGHSIVCYVLHNHVGTLYSSLTNVPKMKLRTSVLKCMASMLSQGIQTVREFIKCFEFGFCFKQLKECAKVSKQQRHEEDARSCFIRFYLAFLVFGDVQTTKKLLEQKDLVCLLMLELHLDKVENISIVLGTIGEKIVNESNMLKTTKLSFFNHAVLLKLVFLVKHNDENIKNLATKLITTLCTNQKYGICFQSKDEFSGKLLNPILLKFLTYVKQSAIIREEVCDLTIETMCACPDLIVPYMNSLSLSLDPRLSDFWCTRLTFLVKLWEGIPKMKNIFKSKRNEMISGNFQNKDAIMKLVIPPNVTRQLFTNGMKNKVHKVKETTLRLLEASLSRCVELKNVLEEYLDTPGSKLSKSEVTQWVDSMICMLPDVTPVVGIRQMGALTVDKLSKDTSLLDDVAEIEAANDMETDSQVLIDPIEMNILLELSVKCLGMYQTLKPGILTLSGFNICKLLIFSRNVPDDIISRSLQILLNEPIGGVSMWLKKKISGPDNIFHMILKIMLTWKNNEDILVNSRKLFFNILNNMGQFHDYAFEVNSWVTYFSSAESSDTGEKVLVKEFAGACIDTVTKPFMYLENISSVFKEHESINRLDKSEFRLPSPLFFAILRNMTTETVIKHLIIPVMKDLVITHDSPALFIKILLQEVRDDCLDFYAEFLNFNEKFISDVTNGNIEPTVLITNLMPLLLDVMKITSANDEFASKVKSLLWDNILGLKELPLHVVKLLILLLSYTTDVEKIECVNKIIVGLKNEYVAEEVETMFRFCQKAMSALSDGKKQKLCLLELVTVVMETITNTNLTDDIFALCINNLLCFIQMISRFETKLKSHRYAQLCSIWVKFIKKILKGKYHDSLTMTILSECIQVLYTNKQFVKTCSLQLKDFYQLVVSHSKFFEIMFSEDETMVKQKLVLIKMVSILIELSNVYTPALVPMLLVAYETNLSEKDHYILSILQKFEKNDVSLSQFYPFVWGNNAFSVYKEKELQNSLFKEQSSSQVLENVDKQKMLKSAIEFPIYLSFENHEEVILHKDNYDPLFYLPLFVSLMQPACVVDCYHFVESGCLSFTCSAISSFDLTIRKLAYTVLSLYNDHLESARFREKGQITYLLMLLKHSVMEEYMRFPSIWACYLIQYIKFVLKPDHHLYTVLSNLILQKPMINVKELPVFLPLFNSYNVEHVIERGWLLKLLVDGLKNLTDYYLYKKYHVFEMLIAFYNTQVCDKNMKLLIHDVFGSACSFSTAIFDLVKTNSLMSWIHINIMELTNSNKSQFYNLLFIIANTFQASSSSKNQEKSANIIPKLLLHEMLLICEHGLQNIDVLDDKDCVQICCVYSWIQSTTNIFGDIHMWQLDVIQIKYFDIITKLLFSTQTEDEQNRVSEIFCNVVSNLSKKDVTLLEGTPWRKIYCFAKDKKMNNVIELFEVLMNKCHTNGNKTLLLRIMNAIK